VGGAGGTSVGGDEGMTLSSAANTSPIGSPPACQAASALPGGPTASAGWVIMSFALPIVVGLPEKLPPAGRSSARTRARVWSASRSS
jgi:hypothetical protein